MRDMILVTIALIVGLAVEVMCIGVVIADSHNQPTYEIPTFDEVVRDMPADGGEIYYNGQHIVVIPD